MKASSNMLSALRYREDTDLPLATSPGTNSGPTQSLRTLVKGVTGYVDSMGVALGQGLREGGVGVVHSPGLSMGVTRPSGRKGLAVTTRFGGMDLTNAGATGVPVQVTKIPLY